MQELKSIDWSQKQFSANGKTYHIYPKVSIQRGVFIEEAKIEMETGQRMGQTFKALSSVYEKLNEGKFADASVQVYNQLKSIEGYFERPAPILRICACILNTNEEDIREITDALVNEKIADWKAEGITMESFFILGLSFLKEETTELLNMQQTASKAMAEMLERMKEHSPKLDQSTSISVS